MVAVEQAGYDELREHEKRRYEKLLKVQRVKDNEMFKKAEETMARMPDDQQVEQHGHETRFS